MADVNISIGADTEALISQLDELKSAVTSLLAAGGFAALVDQLTDFATQVESASAIIGVSTSDMQELGLMAQVSGSSMQGITVAIERMQAMAQRGALATSVQGEALAALGINAKQFIAASPDKQMGMLADATKRLHDEGINAAPALSLISRGLAQMLPELQRGSAGINQFKEDMVNAGAVMTPQVITKLDALGAQATVTWAALKNLAAVFLEAMPTSGFLTAIGNAVGALSKLMTAGQMSAYFMASLDYEMAHLRNQFISAGDSVQEVSKWIGEENEAQARMQSLLDGSSKAYAALVSEEDKATRSVQVNVNAMKQQREAIEEAQLAFQTQIENLKTLQETHQITMSQMVASEKEAAQQRLEAELYAGEEIKKADAQYNQEIAKINTQYAKDVTKEWMQAGDMVASAFNSQLRSLLAGTETIGQAMQKVLGDLIIAIIEQIIKMGVEWVATQAMMAVAGQSSAGLAAADFVSKIQADAALTFAGVAANLSPIMGPAALGPAAAAESVVQAQIAAVPKFAVGTDYVPQDMVAMVHQGEAIIPAEKNTGGGLGGNNFSMNISAVDAASFASMLRRNPNAFNNMLKAMMQRGGFNTVGATP